MAKFRLRKLRVLASPRIAYPFIGVCVAVFVFSMLRPEPDIDDKYRVTENFYYDLATDTLFVENSASVPPVLPPSRQTVEGKPAGVRAFVYGCGDCKAPRIGYLESFTLDAQKAFIDSKTLPGDEVVERVRGGSLIRAFGPSGPMGTWENYSTDEGTVIRKGPFSTCEGGRAITPCRPKDARGFEKQFKVNK